MYYHRRTATPIAAASIPLPEPTIAFAAFVAFAVAEDEAAVAVPEVVVAAVGATEPLIVVVGSVPAL
jgi:hypothetical protein